VSNTARAPVRATIVKHGPSPSPEELLVALKELVEESTMTEMLFASERNGWRPPKLAAARALVARIER
jgi:hypothetical protein